VRTRPLKRYCDGPPQYGLNIAAGEYASEGVRLIRTSDIRPDGSLADPDKGVFVPEVFVEPRHRLRAGDILFSRSGTLGRSIRVADAASHMTFAGFLVRFRPMEGVDPRFLEYCSNSAAFQAAVEADAVTSTISNFNAERYGEVRLPDVDSERQRAIADYLDIETARIDALIAKKQRMIELLDERLAGLLADAISRAGGELVKLGQVLERIIDYRGATPEKVDDGVVLLTASNVVNGRIDLEPSRQFVTEGTYQSWMQRGWPESGDIVFTTEAPLGSVALLEEPRVALAQRLMLFRPRRTLVSSEYLYLYLLSPVGAAEVEQRASGSTVMGIRTDRLRDVPVRVPPLVEQASVVKRAQAFQLVRDQAKLVLQKQINLLREHRQALITASVTGELEVPGVAA
jgi:type I restriction enzyme S subunit